jgi:heat shock protein HslJ
MRPTPAMMLSLLLLGACANPAPPGAPPAETKTTAPLLDTHWKLTQLGELVIPMPQEAREIHFIMHSESQRVAGFSGCNQMMGAYVLDGSELKFEQIGGTLMACVSNMDLEPRFLRMFGKVASWKIDGQTLQLLDTDRKPLATFEARHPE